MREGERELGVMVGGCGILGGRAFPKCNSADQLAITGNSAARQTPFPYAIRLFGTRAFLSMLHGKKAI
ncbi:unnamed protein product [Caenorhabditis auriculariae]|uniref:Uncharacterized protein n=1 Tax=Caenorhabditis auriculariae TaxID=2777116 RepID=A0A8S1H282_9PELO|nr:unnamed protein product [Caenorhabditis auriculariae]